MLLEVFPLKDDLLGEDIVVVRELHDEREVTLPARSTVAELLGSHQGMGMISYVS